MAKENENIEQPQQRDTVTNLVNTTSPVDKKNKKLLEENSPPSFADTIYKKIVSVIGGDNPNQFFCMSLPGTLIDATQYSHDVDKNVLKPAHVKANESKL